MNELHRTFQGRRNKVVPKGIKFWSLLRGWGYTVLEKLDEHKLVSSKVVSITDTDYISGTFLWTSHSHVDCLFCGCRSLGCRLIGEYHTL